MPVPHLPGPQCRNRQRHGDLLNALAPSRGVGIDISPATVEIASRKYPHLTFQVGNAEDLPLTEKFDYIILSDVIGYIPDVQKAFAELRKVTHPRTRVIITYYNFFWEPILRWGAARGRCPNRTELARSRT
jgi:ubiquinone/menaquinone biosynthesis C-methylase UbiE